MQICYKCEVVMKDTKKPETLSFVRTDENGEYSEGFQRFDVYECPECFAKAYGTPGQLYYFDEEMQRLNPHLRDWGDIEHDKIIVVD